MNNVVKLSEARRAWQPRIKAELTRTRAALVGVTLPPPKVDPTLLRRRQLLLERLPERRR